MRRSGLAKVAALRRRQLLAMAAVFACGCDCDRRAPGRRDPTGRARPKPAADGAADGLWRELRLGASDHYDKPEQAAVLVQPKRPLLIALHGAGEARRGIEAGARGWRDDYDLDVAHQRLMKPPLVAKDLLGFVEDERLAQLNQSLEAQPYAGLTVACPYTPSRFDRSVGGAQPFAAFVTEVLIPKVRAIASPAAGRSSTGIDGVSMGGRLALQIGLTHPDVFGAVGALQPAIGETEAEPLAELAAEASARASLKLRLVSSVDDPFLAAVRALAAALKRKRIEHQLIITPGPHDYAWNRGPGSYEMLLWHERVMRGLPPP